MEKFMTARISSLNRIIPQTGTLNFILKLKSLHFRSFSVCFADFTQL